MLTTRPRGTNDILPGTSANWQYVEEIARAICHSFGYKELRTPIFEHTELFLRGIGETTDVVSKEMYTFIDRGDRSITLRPENTAAAVRSYLENKLYAETVPSKLFYIGPMFRYDRPQAGRLRQFHQFGIEAIGAAGPLVDAEIIALAVQFFRRLGLDDLSLYINSVGCPECRPRYKEKLQEFLRDKVADLCEDCQSRFERNPLRILDCKNAKCAALSQGAPEVADCLCDSCHDHFEGLKAFLDSAGIAYTLNPRLVRGLDYYTKTAFEIQYAPLGAQSAVCGGGRYDGLVAECGGESTPGIGLAIGLERVLLALEKQQLLPGQTEKVDVYVVALGTAAQQSAFKLALELRAAGLSVEIDTMNRSMKAQMKQANKFAASYVVILGEDELKSGQAVLRNMQSSEQKQIAINEACQLIQAEMEE
ncbi:MAG: histidine--tRNA ligase [Sporomusaceae bacterium]|nr:histidine--tRNA ligase [Sporomusaceae bacterium]